MLTFKVLRRKTNMALKLVNQFLTFNFFIQGFKISCTMQSQKKRLKEYFRKPLFRSIKIVKQLLLARIWELQTSISP